MFRWNEFGFTSLLDLLFLLELEELLGALPLLGGKFGRLGEQAKANLERVHIL